MLFRFWIFISIVWCVLFGAIILDPNNSYDAGGVVQLALAGLAVWWGLFWVLVPRW